jgi:hypothetical protein
MSDEQRKDEEIEIEVEGHATKAGGYDEPPEEGEIEVEAHVHRAASVRMDSPSKT